MPKDSFRREQTQRRARHSNDCHAEGHQPKWRHLRRVGHVSNGLGERHSRFENSKGAGRHRGHGRAIVSATGRSRGHGGVLRLGGENRPLLDENPGRSVGAAFSSAHGAGAGDARCFYLRRSRRIGATNSRAARLIQSTEKAILPQR